MGRKSDPSGILRRGSACLSCRRRKLRCDGVRPVCQQCNSMRRSHECHFDDSSRKSRTQTLREKVFALEAKLRELEHSGSQSSAQSDSSPSSSSSILVPYEDHDDLHLVNQSSEPPWIGGDLHPALPGEWISMHYGFHPQYEVPAGPSSRSNTPMFLPLDTTIPTYSNYPPTVSPAPFTDSSGTPVHDGPSDRLSEPTLELTAEMHDTLVQAFIDHRKQCCFYCNTSRFDRASSATVYQNTPPNTALMNAIYLMGSFFSQLSGLEKQLLDKTRHEISRSVHNQDNQEQVMDILQALSLVSQYFFFNGQEMEGNHHLKKAKRLAVDLGLNHLPIIPSPFGLDYSFKSASSEWQEKAAVLWQVYMVDKLWPSSSDSCEVQISFEAPSQHITTPLPVLEGVKLEIIAGNSSLHAIFEPDGGFRGSALSVTAFKVIACCIYERSIRLHNTPPSSKDNGAWLYHRSTELALERLSSLVHPFTWRDSFRTENTTFDTDLYVVHTLILASTIHLHLDNVMNLKISWAAKKLVELINHLSDEDYSYLDPVLSISWSSIIKIFSGMIQTATEQINPNTVSPSTNSYTVAFLRHCVEVLLNALQNLRNNLPIADRLLTSPTEKPQSYSTSAFLETLPSFSDDFRIQGLVY